MATKASTTGRLEPLVRLRLEIDRLAVLVATIIFTSIAMGVFVGEVSVLGGSLVLLAFPLALLAANALYPGNLVERELQLAAVWALILIAAFFVVPVVLRMPLLALGLPAAFCMAAICARYPAGTVTSLLLLTGVLGSFQAFIGFSPSLLIDLLIGSLMVVLAVRVVFGRPYTFVLWPAIAVFGVYMLVTVLDLATAEEFSVAWLSFHTTILYMLVALLLAYMGWEQVTYRRIARGFVIVTALVCAYALLRWVIGPAAQEEALARASGVGNIDPLTEGLRTVGSFVTAHQLALWVGAMAPLSAACALLWRGRWRLFAAGVTGLCVLAAFASETRGPLVGMVVGLIVVIALYQVSRAFRGFRGPVLLAAVGGMLAIGGGGLVLSETSPEKFDRYVRIFDPGSDVPYQQRVGKWEVAWDQIEQHPWGQGLGSGGQAQGQAGRFVNPSTTNLDSSYLKVGYEQGLPVMILFIAAMLLLLGSVAWAAVTTRSAEAAAMGMAAAGSLSSLLVSFYSGLYIEATPVLSGWLVLGLGLAYLVAKPAPTSAEDDVPVPHRPSHTGTSPSIPAPQSAGAGAK